MLIALIATTLASDDVDLFVREAQPVTIHNAGNGDLNVLSTLSPYIGEEGHWTAVRFAAKHNLAVEFTDRLCPCGCGGPAPR